ncbi:MAG: hypothetical protein NTV77_00265 [Candidatus Azambacteria bacterium]|nr:hypothetical protein [Candidatus Azambacteria bacterium]
MDTHLDGTISREEYVAKKEKLITEKAELSEKLKDFERNGNHWLEPARQFILAAQQAKIIALQENPVAGRDFLKRIGSNHVLRSQAICFEPKKSWKIPADLPAEGRSPEAINSQHTIWLRHQDSNLEPTPYTYSIVTNGADYIITHKGCEALPPY